MHVVQMGHKMQQGGGGLKLFNYIYWLEENRNKYNHVVHEATKKGFIMLTWCNSPDTVQWIKLHMVYVND